MTPPPRINLSHIALLVAILGPFAGALWQGGGKTQELTALTLRVQAIETQQATFTKETAAALTEISKNVIRLDERDKVKSEVMVEMRNDMKALAGRGKK